MNTHSDRETDVKQMILRLECKEADINNIMILIDILDKNT